MGQPPDLRAGLQALKSGQLQQALRHFDGVLATQPQSIDALCLSGVALAGLGQSKAAVGRLQEAISLRPNHAPLHYNLAKVLQDADRDLEAERAYRETLRLAPDFAEAMANLAILLRERGETAAASAMFQRSFEIRRGERPQVVHPGSELSTTRMKLAHDVEQLEFLMAQGVAFKGLAKMHAAHAQVLGQLDGSAKRPVDATQVLLDRQQQELLAASYNRAHCVRYGEALDSAVLNPGLDRAKIQSDYKRSSPSICVIDDFLQPEALEALWRHCLESTFWHDSRYLGGYLGAYWEQGFGSPLLVQIAAELRAALPNMLGNHALRQMWAYKYDSQGGGIGVHADSAAVNVNFWITPDEANLDQDRGGLLVHHVRAPKDWEHGDYNSWESEAKIETLLAASGADSTRVPYRANRAVLFDSDLFHRTDHYRFKPGYLQRRINVTMLFGWRDGNR
jgi:tetratricopeptide (TPR) repeat protein